MPGFHGTTSEAPLQHLTTSSKEEAFPISILSIPSGGVMKPCDLRLGEDGIYGVCAGYMEVMAKPRDIVVVGSVQKASERREKKMPSKKSS